MGRKPPFPRSGDVTHSWNTRWRRDLKALEKRLNGQLPPDGNEPMDTGNLKSLGRGAGVFLVLGLATDYMNHQINRQNQDIEGRVKDIVRQVSEQLQPGQETMVRILENKAPEVRVSVLAIELIRKGPQMRASDGSPQRIWQEPSSDGAVPDSTVRSLQVRKPRELEDEQCLVSELSHQQSVTTKFRISERNETLEVRHLNIPAEQLGAGHIPTEAPQPPLERHLLERERSALYRHALQMKAEAEAEARNKSEKTSHSKQSEHPDLRFIKH